MEYPYPTRKVSRRTVAMPPERSKQIRVASEYLGVSGEKLIWDAVTAYLRTTYEHMLNELP